MGIRNGAFFVVDKLPEMYTNLKSKSTPNRYHSVDNRPCDFFFRSLQRHCGYTETEKPCCRQPLHRIFRKTAFTFMVMFSCTFAFVVYSQYNAHLAACSEKRVDSVANGMKRDDNLSHATTTTLSHKTTFSHKTTLSHKCSTTNLDEMYLFGRETDDAIGATELQQYTRFLKIYPKFKFNMTQDTKFPPPDGYSYKVRVVSSTEFVIEERRGHSSTGGGSSFLINTTSTSTQNCRYYDFFNGTYTAHCPLPKCSCRNVNIQLQYSNFTAYTGNHKAVQTVIFHKLMCNNQNKAVVSKSYRRKSIKITEGKNVITWYKHNGGWEAILLDGKRYVEMKDSALCGCVKNIRKLVMVGSSHMRYKFDHIAYLCYTMPVDLKRKHQSFKKENINFLWVPTIDQFPKLWDDSLSKEKLGKRDVLIIQTGAHDMGLIGMQNTMAGVAKLEAVIRDLQKKSLRHGFRLLFVTTPPMDEYAPVCQKGSRNSFALAAFNRKLKLDLMTANVKVFDEFNFLLVQYDNVLCGCHYICMTKKNNVSKVAGKVGIMAASMMISNNVCWCVWAMWFCCYDMPMTALSIRHWFCLCTSVNMYWQRSRFCSAFLWHLGLPQHIESFSHLEQPELEGRLLMRKAELRRIMSCSASRDYVSIIIGMHSLAAASRRRLFANSSLRKVKRE